MGSRCDERDGHKTTEQQQHLGSGQEYQWPKVDDAVNGVPDRWQTAAEQQHP
jgi:hypothetical protein